jgi:hypothetical protein
MDRNAIPTAFALAVTGESNGGCVARKGEYSVYNVFMMIFPIVGQVELQKILLLKIIKQRGKFNVIFFDCRLYWKIN